MKTNIENYARYLSDYFGMELEEVTAKTRDRIICQPRQIVSNELLKHFNSFQVAEIMGFKNRSTLTNSKKKVTAYAETDKEFRLLIQGFNQYAKEYSLTAEKELELLPEKY